MSADFIAPVASIALPPDDPPPGVAAAAGIEGPRFGALVAEGLQRLDAQLQGTQVDLQRLAVGEAQNLHQVMVRLEEARLSFQVMLQVRNRLLEAYQDVMRMQV